MKDAFSPGENPNGLMTVTEAATYLRIPVPTTYYLLQNGKLPGVQIGGRWRVKKDGIDRDILGKEKEGQQNITLAISDTGIRGRISALLKNSPAHIQHDTFIGAGENATIITDGNIMEQFGTQINLFRGQIIMVISENTSVANLCNNLDHAGRMVTALPIENLEDPKRGLRAALNLPC